MSLFDLIFKYTENFPIYKQEGWSSKQMGEIPFLGITVIFSVSVFVFEYYLSSRQLRKYHIAKKLPEELKDHVEEVSEHTVGYQ